jgi:hypothetical protein
MEVFLILFCIDAIAKLQVNHLFTSFTCALHKDYTVLHIGEAACVPYFSDGLGKTSIFPTTGVQIIKSDFGLRDNDRIYLLDTERKAQL